MNDLENGIRFEDTSSFLEWGKSIEDLVAAHQGKIEDKGDRTIYNWGKHRILNGLELYLINKYWNFGEEGKNRLFNSIEFWAYGDKHAIEYFDIISLHLIKEIGQPTEKDESIEPERLWVWDLGSVDVKLYFFEQHAYKLHFTIEKKKNVPQQCA